jgi:hypothetical protein
VAVAPVTGTVEVKIGGPEQSAVENIWNVMVPVGFVPPVRVAVSCNCGNVPGRDATVAMVGEANGAATIVVKLVPAAGTGPPRFEVPDARKIASFWIPAAGAASTGMRAAVAWRLMVQLSPGADNTRGAASVVVIA